MGCSNLELAGYLPRYVIAKLQFHLTIFVKGHPTHKQTDKVTWVSVEVLELVGTLARVCGMGYSVHIMQFI